MSDEPWYVEGGFDWIAQAIRTAKNYEATRRKSLESDRFDPSAGDVDLAELLTAIHALDRLAPDPMLNRRAKG